MARAVALILDAAPTAEQVGVPAEVREVQAFRSATRRIVEAGLNNDDRDLLLRMLARQAAHARLPLWALDAMTAEFVEPDTPNIPPLREETAARKLRQVGYECCPVCARRLASEADVERWSRRRRWAAEDAETQRKAVAS